MNDKEKHETKNIDNNDPINRDTNTRIDDNVPEDSEKKGLMDKIMDFFKPDDDSDKIDRDQNKGPMDKDETLHKEDNIRDPLYTPNRKTRVTGIMESDYDRDEGDKVMVGIFDTENEAINVITQLKETGYGEDEISAVAKDKDRMDYIDDATDISTITQGGEGKVGAGAATGGSLEKLAVALPALGLIEIPGFGPIFAAGPITGVFSDVVSGVSGGMVNGLVQMGVSEEDAKNYEQYLKQGKFMIIVQNRVNLQEDIITTFKQNNSIINYESTRELAGSRV